jgi:hypothetical protein
MSCVYWLPKSRMMIEVVSTSQFFRVSVDEQGGKRTSLLPVYFAVVGNRPVEGRGGPLFAQKRAKNGPPSVGLGLGVIDMGYPALVRSFGVARIV